jgi:hypothetical protein
MYAVRFVLSVVFDYFAVIPLYVGREAHLQLTANREQHRAVRRPAARMEILQNMFAQKNTN